MIDLNRVYVGDSLAVMRTWPDAFVQCVVTSVPYWGLRDYGVEGQYGLEKSPEAYIAKMVEVFRELKRIMRDDAVLFLNMGDCYQDKQLVGMPWRLAFALQADGCWLRSDIIWFKTNPMPEALNGWRWERHRVKVKDGIKHSGGTRGNANGAFESSLHTQGRYAQWRECPGCPKCEANDGLILRKGSWRPTSAHEYIFMLTKSANYYADGEAVRDAAQDWGQRDRKPGSAFVDGTPGRSKQFGGKDCDFAQRGRNLRNVWRISTAPFAGAHFATFAPKIPELCIKAGTSDKGACPKCGGPWVRVVNRKFVGSYHDHKADGIQYGLRQNGAGPAKTWNIPETLGWRPSCACDAGEPVPCVVLDPFMGAGTTGLVAEKLGRDWLGIELNPEYVEMAEARIRKATTTPLFEEAR